MNQITSPTIQKQVNEAKDILAGRAEIARFEAQQAENTEIIKLAPTLKAKLEAIEKQLARPVQLNATLRQPAVAKRTQTKSTMYELLATVVGAEILRKSSQADPATFIEAAWPGEQHALTRKYAAMMYKDATTSATTTHSGWATELVNHIRGSYFETLAPRSAMAQLGKVCRQLIFNGAASVTYPTRERDTLAAAFVQEDGTIPVKAGKFLSSTASRYKIGLLSSVTNELRVVSAPEIVNIISQAMIEDSATALDGHFLDANAAIGGVRPAGIMHGATTQASAGGTIENVYTDLKWLLSNLISIRARTPVMLLNPLTVAALTMKPAAGIGVSPFTAEINTGKLAGIPFITSANCAVDQVIALDADNLLIGLDRPEFDTSQEATIVMISDDGVAPTMAETDGVTTAGSVKVSGAAAVSAPTHSVFQMNSTACRFVQPVSWAFNRPGVVFAVTGVAW
jgi:HK97 family phage major capsid protein